MIPGKPTKLVQVEFYTVALPLPIVMFVKGKEKRTLVENFLESIKVEKDLASISNHQGNEESKPSSSEKSIKKNKGIPKLIQRRSTMIQCIWKACRESSSNSLMRLLI